MTQRSGGRSVVCFLLYRCFFLLRLIHFVFIRRSKREFSGTKRRRIIKMLCGAGVACEGKGSGRGQALRMWVAHQFPEPSLCLPRYFL